MVAPVDIYNAAMGLAGARSIIANFQENNPEAQQALLWYDADRRWLLREHRWNFAREQGALTLQATAPGINQTPATNLPWPFMPWAFQYAYPSDCVQFCQIIPTYNAAPITPQPYTTQQPPTPWQESSMLSQSNVVVKSILTNQCNAIGVWSRDITDCDLFDPQFIEALEFLIASHVSIPLSGNQSLAKSLYQQAIGVIERAKARDGVEGLTVHNIPVDWMLVRGYAADYTTGAYPYGWGWGGPGYGGFGWYI
jgi:hypothetical protein